MQEPTTIELGRDDEGRRADRVVRKALKSVSLSTIYRLFRQKRIRIGARAIGADEHLKAGDILNLFLPYNLNTETISSHSEQPPAFDESVLATLPDQPRVVWENEYLAALHKPRGMLTHDGSASLEAFVRNYLHESLPPSASFIPGPLHRLDRNTSGIVMFSKSRAGAEAFSKELTAHHIRKFYIAIAHGEIENGATLEDRLRRDQHQRRTFAAEQGEFGKLRVTPLAGKEGMTLVLIELHTGLTHQIRAQLSAHGHPLKGDAKYGNNERMNPDGYFLHAHTLVLPRFLDAEMPHVLSDPLPSDFKEWALKIVESNIIHDSCFFDKRLARGAANLDECILRIIENMI